MTDQKFDPNVIGEKIIKTIKTIFDPEIPVDIYELGQAHICPLGSQGQILF